MSHFSHNPYEAIVNGSSSSRPAEKKVAERPAPPSSVLSKATKRRQVQKPRARVGVRYRYQFEMPPPTMDCKMLMGQLSPATFADPVFTALERNARPVATPADPSHGLRANLVDPSIYGEGPPLSVEDDALLLAIESERPGASASQKLRSAQKGASLPPPRRAAQAPAPWMRRMSYDEYLGKSTSIARPMSGIINMNGPTTLSGMSRTVPQKEPSSELAAKSVERSFQLVNKSLKHPDKRKAHLKPTSIVPVFPDFMSMGSEFIAIEFEKSAILTHGERVKDPELLEKSTRAMVTISLAEDDKKYLACFTPADSTLEALDDESRNEADDDASDGEKSLMYDWVHEYAIREGGKGLTGPRNMRNKGIVKPARGCYALAEHEGLDGKRVATLKRIGTNWKLSRRLGTLPRLGKPHLQLNSVKLSKESKDNNLMSNLETIDKST